MYFKATEELQASYTIRCDNYANFSQTLNTNTLSGYTTEHEYLLIGAIEIDNIIKINFFNLCIIFTSASIMYVNYVKNVAFI